jgi:hypothetical protein
MRTVRIAAAALALAALLATAACSAASVGGSSPTFQNQQYGFALEYPQGYVTAQASPPPKGSAMKYSVVFADPKGSTVNGQLVDAVSVAVYKLNHAATPEAIAKHTADFKALVQQLLGSNKQLHLAGPPTTVQVNGSTAFSVTYTYKLGDVDVGAMTYLIPHGDYAFVVTGQTTRDKWDSEGRTLGSMMETFRFPQ